jgi:hypothetical protein
MLTAWVTTPGTVSVDAQLRPDRAVRSVGCDHPPGLQRALRVCVSVDDVRRYRAVPVDHIDEFPRITNGGPRNHRSIPQDRLCQILKANQRCLGTGGCGPRVGTDEPFEGWGQQIVTDKDGNLRRRQPYLAQRRRHSPSPHQLHRPDRDTAAAREVHRTSVLLDHYAVDPEVSESKCHGQPHRAATDDEYVGLGGLDHSVNLGSIWGNVTGGTWWTSLSRWFLEVLVILFWLASGTNL